MSETEENQQEVAAQMFPQSKKNITEADLDRQMIIESLKQLKGIGESKAEKLIDAGYYSLESIAVADVRDFMERTGLPKGSSEQLIANARGLVGLGEFEDLDTIAEKESNYKYLKTGVVDLDALLGGGFEPGHITEIHALNGVGKTQMCISMAVRATLPEDQGGLDCHVLYVDAENTFSAKRALQIAEDNGYDVSTVAKRIHCVRASSSAHQILLMDKINEEAAKYPVKLLIVDSIISHFRNEYIGRGALAERQQQLNRYLGQLHEFAISNDAVVIVTNQMMSSPDGAFAFGPTEIAVGGNCLGHACATRLLLRRAKAGMRVVRLEKSPKLPSGEAVFKLTNKGLEEP